MTRRLDTNTLASVVASIRDRFPLSGVAAKAGVKLQLPLPQHQQFLFQQIL